MDPLVYDGTFLAGKHNGGFLNSFNHGSYIYCYQNPLRLIDPNGKQVNVINEGIALGNNVVNDITPKVERERMKSIQGIVLHRTVSNNSESAIKTAKSHDGRTGFHIVVDKDGATTQIVNFNNRANHVGKQKLDIGNYNSIGIEVVGMYHEDTQSWDTLTPLQVESVAQATFTIMNEYGLHIDDIYPHEDASWKTEGEGQVVLDAITSRLNELTNPKPKEISKQVRTKEDIPESVTDGGLQGQKDIQSHKANKSQIKAKKL